MANKISSNLGIPLTPTQIEKFSDGETYVRIKEKVRGDDVFLIQTLGNPVNENLMELLVTIDALKRASARRINIICPYLAYSRQDRKVISREPVTAKLVANLISKAGADRVVTVDLHSDQIQGFYDIPFDHFVGYPQFANYLKDEDYEDMVIAAPDTGAMKRCRKMAGLLLVPLVVLDKRRVGHNQSEVVRVIGDVENKLVVIVDDIIDTGGTITNAAKVLKQAGAKDIIICATHALLSGSAVGRLEISPISKILLLDTVPLSEKKN
ncbi:MAG: ribose-phosphate diphosphokinase [Patescibacteria group bacterium]|nr:ribose-phosphate diphosphokinase [Patescibacteria group bacterium]